MSTNDHGAVNATNGTAAEPLEKLHVFCSEEMQRSMKCLEASNYDKDKCQEAFADFKDCKKVWQRKRKERGGRFL